MTRMSYELQFIALERGKSLASQMAGWVSYLPEDLQVYARESLCKFWEAYTLQEQPTVDEYKRERKAALARIILEADDIE